jgi:phosphatidylinositol alpha-1,6-mannosyltransferase
MILFVTRKYPPSVGGMQRVSLELTREVAKRRSATVMTLRGARIVSPSHWVWLISRALQLKRSVGVSVIHLGDGVVAGLGVALRRVCQAPTAITVHGLDVTWQFPGYQALTPRLLSDYDAVIAVSDYTRQECLRRGLRSDQCSVIPNGVSLTVPHSFTRSAARQELERRYRLDLRDREVLLTTGRLVRRKGVASFIEGVLPRLAAERPKLHYLVVGDGPDRERIGDSIARQGLSSRVSLLGRVDERLLWAAYQACDLFVMPNIAVPGDAEGFGVVSLEASLAGRCVVAADREGIRDALADGTTGVLMPWDQPLVQGRVLSELLSNPDLADQLGQRAHQVVIDRFGWPAVAGRYLDLFDRLIDKARVKP